MTLLCMDTPKESEAPAIHCVQPTLSILYPVHSMPLGHVMVPTACVPTAYTQRCVTLLPSIVVDACIAA